MTIYKDLHLLASIPRQHHHTSDLLIFTRKARTVSLKTCGKTTVLSVCSNYINAGSFTKIKYCSVGNSIGDDCQHATVLQHLLQSASTVVNQSWSNYWCCLQLGLKASSNDYNLHLSQQFFFLWVHKKRWFCIGDVLGTLTVQTNLDKVKHDTMSHEWPSCSYSLWNIRLKGSWTTIT